MYKYLIIFMILISSACLNAGMQNYKKISAKESYHLIQKNRGNKNFVILDIRTKPEYDAGHIKNSIMIDYYAADFKANIGKLDRNKTYLVYCRTGNRSGRSMSIFSQLGFKVIYDMHDGIRGWYLANLPIVK